jgi:hypothetical protein
VRNCTVGAFLVDVRLFQLNDPNTLSMSKSALVWIISMVPLISKSLCNTSFDSPVAASFAHSSSLIHDSLDPYTFSQLRVGGPGAKMRTLYPSKGWMIKTLTSIMPGL